MLNRTKGAAPLYFQLQTILREKIECGEYAKGDVFPSEKMLMDQYEVSRMTVRQACAALIQDGYIKSGRGIGTIVIYEKIDEHLNQVISFTDEMRRHNITMKTTYCKMEKVYPPVQAAKVLGMAVTERCYCLTRVRCVGGKPLVYTVTYLKPILELSMDSEQYGDSLYQYLREVHGAVIEKGRDTLEASLPTEEVQGFLQIDSQMPVFKRTRQTYLKNNSIFEFSVCYYPGNRYQYTVDL